MSTPHVTAAELKPYDFSSTDLDAAMKYLYGLYLVTGGEPDKIYREYNGTNAKSYTFSSYPHNTTLRAQIVTSNRMVMYYQSYTHMEGAEVDLTGSPNYDIQLIELAQQARALRDMHARSIKGSN